MSNTPQEFENQPDDIPENIAAPGINVDTDQPLEDSDADEYTKQRLVELELQYQECADFIQEHYGKKSEVNNDEIPPSFEEIMDIDLVASLGYLEKGTEDELQHSKSQVDLRNSMSDDLYKKTLDEDTTEVIKQYVPPPVRKSNR